MSEVMFTDMTDESAAEVNVPMIFPLTTKATDEKKTFRFNKASPLHVQTMEKLQPKLLPPNNESLADISMSTNGRESHVAELDKRLMCWERQVQGSVRESKPLADILNTYRVEDAKNSNKERQIKILNNEAVVIRSIITGIQQSILETLINHGSALELFKEYWTISDVQMPLDVTLAI